MHCLFLFHKFIPVPGTFTKTGDIALDWALNKRPEYQQLEKCKYCAAEKKTRWISLADRPL